MHAAITFVALWGAVAPQLKIAMTWENDYRQARAAGIRDHKPLAVFVGRGAEGWKKLLSDGSLSQEARNALARHYVPVYLDQHTDVGKYMAEAFQLAGNGGIIISDRTGGVIAFRHEGELTSTDLARHLNRFADPSFVVSTTEGAKPTAQPVYAVPAHTAYYQPFQNPANCQT